MGLPLQNWNQVHFKFWAQAQLKSSARRVRKLYDRTLDQNWVSINIQLADPLKVSVNKLVQNPNSKNYGRFDHTKGT